MSVISRMLQDLEARGAAMPLQRSMPVQGKETSLDAAVPSWARERSESHTWLRSLLLSTGLLAGVMGVYNTQLTDWAPAWVAKHDAQVNSAHTAPRAAQPKVTVAAQTAATEPSNVASRTEDWRMDLALSLGLIKPRPVHVHRPDLTKVSMSPSQDVNGDAVDTRESKGSEPPRADAKADKFVMIDPPAAGQFQSTAKQAVEAYRRALDLSEQGRDAAALESAMQAIKLDPHHLPARRLAVALALDHKQLDQASMLVEEGLKQDPRDNELLFLHARRLAAIGSSEQALTVLQGLDRPNGEALGLKAGLLARTGRYAPAALAYEQALKTRPDNATWWLGLGVAWSAQGQTAMAKEAYSRARKLGQLSADVQAWLDQQI